MESLEAFSAEPRNAPLIRGCYRDLVRVHVVTPPSMFTAAQGNRRALDSEPLMWTPGVSLCSGTEVWLPAELAFVPFLPKDYGTRQIYPCNSNGLAGGATYLEAVLAGLYELIERHLLAQWSLGFPCEVERVPPGARWRDDAERVRRELPGFEMQLYSLALPGLRGLPVCLALLMGHREVYLATGCHADPTRAASRAAKEVLQIVATYATGAREDLLERETAQTRRTERKLQSALHKLPSNYPRTPRPYAQVSRSDLRSELHDVLRWLSTAGYPEAFAVNLTRVGIDVPIVKVIVPGMRGLTDDLHSFSPGMADAYRWSYGR